MARLKVRTIPFKFDANTPYYWNKGNPYWGNAVNRISLIGPAFERYFIKGIRQSIPKITDTSLKEDADLFCLQEGQHAKQHMAHLQALFQQYPGLEETQGLIKASYDRLFDAHPLEFHLSYAASVEVTFGPIAQFMVENRHALFRDCDNQIAALILWHFVEEFEHRNSAIDVYNHVVGDYWYRMKTAPLVMKHLMEVEAITQEGLRKHVPPLITADKTIDSQDLTGLFKDIPFSSIAKIIWHLFCSQMPLHRPDRLAQPEWATRWFADEAAGKDMTIYTP